MAIKIDKGMLKAAWPPLLALSLFTASQSFCNKPEDNNTTLSQRVLAEEKESGGISYEQAQKNPELRQAYINQIYENRFKNIKELSEIMYDSDFLRIPEELRGRFKRRCNFAVTLEQPNEFSRGIARPIRLSKCCFEGSHNDEDGLLVCNEDDLISTINHELVHVKDIYHGVLIGDIFVDNFNYEPLDKNNVLGFVLEFRAQLEEFRQIMQNDKISSHYVYRSSKVLRFIAERLTDFSQDEQLRGIDRHIAFETLKTIDKEVVGFAYSRINELKDKYELSIIKR